MTPQDPRCSCALLALFSLLGCFASRPPDAADTNTNWLECEVTRDCSGGLACIEGYCRVPEQAQTPMTAEQVPSNGPQATAGTGVAAVEPGLLNLSAGDPFPLSTLERSGGAPRVRWLDSQWTVAWNASGPDGQGDLKPWLEVARVTGDGEVSERRLLPAGYYSHALSIAGEGTIGQIAELRACSLELMASDGSGQESFAIDCAADGSSVAAAPIPGSDEWLVAYRTGQPGRGLVVGRYDREDGDWRVEPVVVTPRRYDYAVLQVFAHGGDAFIAWSDADNRTSLSIARGLADPADPEHAPELSAWELDAEVLREDGHYAFAPGQSGPLLFGADGERLWMAPLADLTASPPVFTVAATGVADRPPGVVAMPELGLVAACYATGPGPGGGFGRGEDGVSCVAVDEAGNTGEPLVLADDLENIGGVDVGWSGDTLLVAYWSVSSEPDDQVLGQLLSPALMLPAALR